MTSRRIFADVFVYILPQLYKERLKSLFNLVTGEMFGFFGAINEEKMAFKNCKFLSSEALMKIWSFKPASSIFRTSVFEAPSETLSLIVMKQIFKQRFSYN